MLEGYDGFQGVIKGFRTGEEALQFLQTVKSQGYLEAADLIFMTFCMKESQGLLLLDQIFDLYDKQGIPRHKTKVIICSTIDL